MTTHEDSEMLELCETEVDDLRAQEDLKKPESPESDTLQESGVKKLDQLHEKSSSTVIDKEVEFLYKSLGIDLKDSKMVSDSRLDTIHMFGVNEMSTEDVYTFFHPMKPMTVEWINDSSCNIVWPDENSAAKALLEFSIPGSAQSPLTLAKVESRSSTNESEDQNKILVVEEDDEEEEEIRESSEDGELPDDDKVETNDLWRVSIHGKNKSLKFRFATWADKKVRGAEKYSDYYKKYGNPNFGGMKGLISNSRKRRLRQQTSSEHVGSSTEDPEENELVEDARQRITQITTERERKEPQKKRPKMKMYADEEEKKSRKQKDSRILNRLGNITVNISLDEDERVSSDYDELEVSSPQEFGSKSVWDRLQVEVPNTRYPTKGEKKSRRGSDSERDTQRDLRKKLQTIRRNKNDNTSPLLLSSSTK